MRLTNLDMDVLRTLALAVDNGGFGKAASIIGRSQSAVSLQMRRLEDQVGTKLFHRSGRALLLNEAGEIVLDYGRRMLQLNDDALSAARRLGQVQSIKLGLPADLSEVLLTRVLSSFALQFPHIHIETRVDRNADLVDQVLHSQLDIALAFGRHDAEGGEQIAALPIHWIASRRNLPNLDTGVPLVLFDAPCLFRDAGIAALNQAARTWRIALTSPSLNGLWAATEAGLGISVRTRLGLTPGLRVVEEGEDLPAIGQSVPLSLYRAPTALNDPVEILRNIAMGCVRDILDQTA